MIKPMPKKAFHAVCTDVLQQHLDDPWRWLRENDLVVDVVTRVRDRLPARALAARLTGPGFDRRLIDASRLPRKIQRVRTEVKVARSEKEANATEDEDDESPKKKDRIDVCVLVDDHVVDVVIHEKGVRDVVLKVTERDVAGLLEVKLYSDLYIQSGHCGWLDDLVKLSRIANNAVRGVLYLDTALPLTSVSINYRQKRRELSTLRRSAGNLPPWPLVDGASFEVHYNDRSNVSRTMSFHHVAEPDDVGPYLWALAVRPSTQWSPSFVSRSSILLPVVDVVPNCWRVSFTNKNP